MGNSSSSGRAHPHDETVDMGKLFPQGVYTGPQDWNHTVVTQLITERRIAPFYRPLEDYEETWDAEQILAARKPLHTFEHGQGGGNGSSTNESASMGTRQLHSSSVEASNAHGKHSNTQGSHSKRPQLQKDVTHNPEAEIYRGAVECPICFLYYPPNINFSRCCDQAICTECFVQIKRADPTTTHIVSEPAACPYCVQDNFGVVYKPPPWRTGIGSENSPGPESPIGSQDATPRTVQVHKRRQKSFSADSPEVTTIDHIRPDWEAKLEAVKAAVTRRANRRIIMRQVGDRLIPIGVTSGRAQLLSPEEGGSGVEIHEGGGGRRSRRNRNQMNDINNVLGTMGLGGADLEELMLMEAMRLSLVEHEEQQRKQAAANNGNDTSNNNGATSSSQTSMSLPRTSNLQSRSDSMAAISSAPSLSHFPPSMSSHHRPRSTDQSDPTSSLTNRERSPLSSPPDVALPATSSTSLASETTIAAVQEPESYNVLTSSPEESTVRDPLLSSSAENPTSSSPLVSDNNHTHN